MSIYLIQVLQICQKLRGTLSMQYVVDEERTKGGEGGDPKLGWPYTGTNFIAPLRMHI